MLCFLWSIEEVHGLGVSKMYRFSRYFCLLLVFHPGSLILHMEFLSRVIFNHGM